MMVSKGVEELGFCPRESKRRKYYTTKPEMDEEEAATWNSGDHVLDRSTRVATKLHADADRKMAGHANMGLVRGQRLRSFAAPMQGSVRA